jgi:hypothetical protein
LVVDTVAARPNAARIGRPVQHCGGSNTGDPSGAEGPGSDFDWIAQIGRDHHVDVLFPNCWTNSLGRMIRGVNPELVITGHENEMSHTVEHREDYTQTWNRLFESRYPALVMTWGESYHYRKDPVRQAARKPNG